MTEIPGSTGKGEAGRPQLLTDSSQRKDKETLHESARLLAEFMYSLFVQRESLGLA